MADLIDDEEKDTIDEALEGERVDLGDDVDVEVEDTEDGGAVIRLKNEEDDRANLDHFANIVEEVDQSALKDTVVELMELIERDKEARKKRDELYEEGLRRTGLGDDAPGGAKFSGATKVVHPMLVEACVDFSARVMKEIFPPAGPVKTKIVGERDRKKVLKAERKAEFMNWQLTEQMQEFRGELEQLSTQLPLGGSQYLKLWFNRETHKPCAEFVPVDDVYLPFAATNFYAAERKTHVQYLTAAKYRKRVKAGMYIDVDLAVPLDPDFSRASKANDKIEGREETSYNEDGLRTVYEVYVSLDIEDEDEFRPYILTIDKTTEKALALYRNWDKDDESYAELDWMVEFGFVPWRGAYQIGLTHMIGGLSGAATGALRALMDSAHIQNVPTLMKLKGGPDGQTLQLQPTEIAEIDGGGMIDDIRKLVMGVPFNQPSPVLFQLLGFLIDAGKGVVQTSFEKLADQNPNAPVGTTLALIEQGMVVFSSIHSRLHASMGRALKIIHRINSAYLTEEDVKLQAGDMDIDPSDFDGPMDVVPVSDPNIFSETQRFAQIQAVMQRSTAMPQMYDLRKVEEMFLRTLKVEADILQPKPGEQDLDPVSENVAATLGRPVYVLPRQDHMAHLKTHMAFLQSPLFGQNPVVMRTYLFPMAQHLRDHMLNYYMVECQKAVSEAQEQGIITDDPTQEVQLIARVQIQIEQELAGFAPLLAQIDQMAQQFKPQPPMPPDNSLQVAQLNAQMKTQELQQRQQLEAQKLQIQQQTEAQRLQAQQQTEAQKAQERMAIEQMQMQDAERSRQQEMLREQLRQSSENQRNAADIDARVSMNNQDNDTAMRLAAAEIASGERVAVSTGTGINPNP